MKVTDASVGRNQRPKNHDWLIYNPDGSRVNRSAEEDPEEVKRTQAKGARHHNITRRKRTVVQDRGYIRRRMIEEGNQKKHQLNRKPRR